MHHATTYSTRIRQNGGLAVHSAKRDTTNHAFQSATQQLVMKYKTRILRV